MRERLLQYRGAALTTDTIEALRQLEIRLARFGNVELEFSGPRKPEMSWNGLARSRGPTEQPAHTSLRIAGREIYLTLKYKEDPLVDPGTVEARELATLWGGAIPLGFTPWNRYPTPGRTQQVFHYLGPWNLLYDHLIGEGKGEFAWASVCAAAQLDVGTWEGGRETEMFVQAQLHRIGLNPGIVDGQIRDRTVATIKAAGYDGSALKELAKVLAERKNSKAATEERTIGHVVVPNRKFSVSSYGGVKTTRTQSGVALTIEGPGRLVVDL